MIELDFTQLLLFLAVFVSPFILIFGFVIHELYFVPRLERKSGLGRKDCCKCGQRLKIYTTWGYRYTNGKKRWVPTKYEHLQHTGVRDCSIPDVMMSAWD